MATIRRMETGYFIADNAIFDRKDLTCQEKLVYFNLCRRADSESCSFPSYQKIADDCSISRRSAIRVIEALQTKGLLSKQMRRKREGDYTSNEYIILPPVDGTERKNTTIPDMLNTTQAEYGGGDTQSPPIEGGVVTQSHQGSDTQSLGWCQRVTRVVTQSHPKGTHVRNHVVVVNPREASNSENSEQSDHTDSLSNKKLETIAAAFGTNISVDNNVLNVCSLEDVKKAVAAVQAYADRNDVQNVPGLLTKALSERWAVRPRTAPPALKKPDYRRGGTGKKKTTTEGVDQHQLDLIKTLYIT